MSDHLPKDLTELLTQMLGGEVKILDLGAIQLPKVSVMEYAEGLVEKFAFIAGMNWEKFFADYNAIEKPGCGCGQCRLRYRYLRRMCLLMQKEFERVKPEMVAIAQQANEAANALERVTQSHHNPNNAN